MSLSLLATVLLSFGAFAQPLAQRLDKRLHQGHVPEGQLSLAVYELGSEPKLVFTSNADADFIPASITKMVTAGAVLARLGPAHKFQTGLWTAGEVKGETLKGDLILKGGGDSGFVSETMWFLVNEFRRTGIRKITGDLIVDDNEFDRVRTDPSRDPERVDRAYDAPIGAMSFNWNSLNIFVRPTTPGEKPDVILDPIEFGLKVDNKAQTTLKGGNALEVSRVNDRIVVRGKVGRDVPEVAVFKNIDDPDVWAGANLLSFLQQRGITVSGRVRSGKTPEGARQLAKAESKPVAHHVADMMKFSNNYVAEMLTKSLALHNGQRPASMEAGMQLVRAQLEAAGVPASRFQLVNPSGLSRRNKVKAADLAKFLVHAETQFSWFPEFLSSFPLAGLDGTLKRRYRNSEAEGWVRAKTGNLNGVVALAGYAGQKTGGLRAFVFVFNGKEALADRVRQLFDQLAEELVQ